MSINDYILIATSLNEEELLQLFEAKRNPLISIKTHHLSPQNSYKWVLTANYNICCSKVEMWELESLKRSYDIQPNLSLYISYPKYNIVEGRQELLQNTANLLHQIEGDVIFQYQDIPILLRHNNVLKIVITEWASDLRALLPEPYELVDVID